MKENYPDSVDQVIIRDLKIQAIIGVYEWERTEPQDVLVNLILFTDLNAAEASDDIADTIDYAVVAEKIQSHANQAARRTVEALASDLADLCLGFDGVQGVRVRVEKTAALSNARAVGVQIERRRD